MYVRVFVRLFYLSSASWLVASPLWINRAVASMKGPWLDNAVSDVLSERYGSPVAVRNVHFERWDFLRFGEFAVDTKEGKPLIRATGGAIRLHRLDLSKKGASETFIHFENIFFTRAYYGNSPAAGTWKFLLHKPLHIRELCFLVTQDRVSTKVRVIDCRSEGVRISGDLEVKRSGTFRNDLRVNISPWTALYSMV